MHKFTKKKRNTTNTNSNPFKSPLNNRTDSSSTGYKVTFKNLKFDFEYDDAYIDFDEFEKWSTKDLSKNKTPSLK